MAEKTAICKLADTVMSYNRNAIMAAANDLLASGIDPMEAIEKGLMQGIAEVEGKFGRHEIAIPPYYGGRKGDGQDIMKNL